MMHPEVIHTDLRHIQFVDDILNDYRRLIGEKYTGLLLILDIHQFLHHLMDIEHRRRLCRNRVQQLTDNLLAYYKDDSGNLSKIAPIFKINEELTKLALHHNPVTIYRDIRKVITLNSFDWIIMVLGDKDNSDIEEYLDIYLTTKILLDEMYEYLVDRSKTKTRRIHFNNMVSKYRSLLGIKGNPSLTLPELTHA